MHALLLLADGRFPAGGHAHSAGVEAAVQDGRITDVVSLTAFTEGRLRTVGLVDIAFAMATAVHLGPSGPAEQEARGQPPDDATAHRLLRTLDVEVDARTPAPPLRAASRRLGRQLVRVGARCWPSALLDLVVEAGFDPHQAVAFGLVGLAGGLGVEDIGHLVAHHTVTTPMLAGVRLLGLDPFAVAASMAALSVVAAAVITAAVDQAAGPIETLPARSASLIDLAAVTHATADGRLFAT
jgi:urease accessory protein